MTLVYVLKRFPKISETFILDEIRELRRQGEEVIVCSLNRPHPGEPRHQGADAVVGSTLYLPSGLRRVFSLTAAAASTVIASPGRSLDALGWCLHWALRTRRLDHLKRFGEAAYLHRRLPQAIDRLHAHFAHGPTSVALLFGRLSGRPFSFTAHARDIFELVPPPLLRAKVAEASFVVAVSEYTRDQIVRRVGSAHAAKVMVVRNGLDRGEFPPRPAEPDATPRVLTVARLVPKKGIQTLIEAAALLVAGGMEFECEVIGDGPQRDQLVAQARRLGLEGQVRWRGSQPRSEVGAAFARATVFVLPCRELPSGDKDGLPVAITEALSVGVPVVTTPVSGIPEVIVDGTSGILVPPGQAQALADALQRLLTDRALRARLAAGGRKAAAGYDIRTTVSRLRELHHPVARAA